MTDEQANNGPDDGDDRGDDEENEQERPGGGLMFWGLVLTMSSVLVYLWGEANNKSKAEVILLASVVGIAGISLFLAGLGQRQRWWF